MTFTDRAVGVLLLLTVAAIMAYKISMQRRQ